MISKVHPLDFLLISNVFINIHEYTKIICISDYKSAMSLHSVGTKFKSLG